MESHRFQLSACSSQTPRRTKAQAFHLLRRAASHWLARLLLLAAGVAIRLLNLARKPFWFDECFSVEVARIGWGTFLRLLWWREANMALYYLLLRIWLHFGQSEFFVRSLSVLFAAATLPAIYWLARILYDRRVALDCRGPVHVQRLQRSLRTGGAQLRAVSAAGHACFGVPDSYLREPTRRNWLGYIVASILAVYSHFYALLLVATHWLAMRPSRIRKDCRGANFLRNFGAPGSRLASQCCLCWSSWPRRGLGRSAGFTRPSLRDLFEFYEHLSGGSTWILPVLYIAACLAAVLPARKEAVRSRSDLGNRGEPSSC